MFAIWISNGDLFYGTNTSVMTNYKQLILVDVCGLFKVLAWNGAWHFVTFIDDFSAKRWLHLIS